MFIEKLKGAKKVTEGKPVSLAWDEQKHEKYSLKQCDHCQQNCFECAVGIKKSADNSVKNGKVQEAIEKYLNVGEMAEDYAENWLCLACAYGISGDYEKALKYVNKALKIDPVYGAAMYEKANILRSLYRYDEAIETYEEIEEHYDVPLVSQKKNDTMLMKNNSSSMLNENDFKTNLLEALAAKGKERGYISNYFQPIEAVTRIAPVFVLSLLSNKELISLFQNNLSGYYQMVCAISTSAGLYCTHQYCQSPETFHTIGEKMGSIDMMSEMLQVYGWTKDSEEYKKWYAFLSELISITMQALNPYWELKDVHPYVVNAMGMLYQAGMLIEQTRQVKE
ncbi:MAG: tetratricopeptide repeat protein [Clostridiales bacterium]|nr:tetratricopeptide repeat protein [Clostridiales bacterium]